MATKSWTEYVSGFQITSILKSEGQTFFSVGKKKLKKANDFQSIKYEKKKIEQKRKKPIF